MTRVFDREAGRIAALEAAPKIGGMREESVTWASLVANAKLLLARTKATRNKQLIKEIKHHLKLITEMMATYDKMSIDYLCD